MKKGLLILLILLFSFRSAFCQIYQKNNSYGFEYKGLKVDRAFGLPVIDTLLPPDIPTDIQKAGHLACYIHGGDTAIVFYNGQSWVNLMPIERPKETYSYYLTSTQSNTVGLVITDTSLKNAKILYISTAGIELDGPGGASPSYIFDDNTGAIDFTPLQVIYTGDKFHVIYKK